jgi:transcriptional regulator GlxA family with amidase domain
MLQDNCLGSAVSSILDILAVAESVRPSVDPSIPPLEVVVAASSRRVRSTAGATFTATRTLRELDDLDVVLIPAPATFTGADTKTALESLQGRAAVRALLAVAPRGPRIAAACTGVFTLAETGLLDGRRVTTTWFLVSTFRERYPTVSVDLNRMVVADGPFLTAGAAFAHIDLALTIVREMSADLARRVARLLLVDDRPSQATYVIYDHLFHEDPIVLAFERHVRQHLEQKFDTSAVAREIGTSRRTLERRTRGTLGLSPLEIVQRLRMERADHLRQTTDLTTDGIAHRVGYSSPETLRALRRRSLRGGAANSAPNGESIGR